MKKGLPLGTKFVQETGDQTQPVRTTEKSLGEMTHPSQDQERSAIEHHQIQYIQVLYPQPANREKS